MTETANNVQTWINRNGCNYETPHLSFENTKVFVLMCWMSQSRVIMRSRVQLGDPLISMWRIETHSSESDLTKLSTEQMTSLAGLACLRGLYSHLLYSATASSFDFCTGENPVQRRLFIFSPANGPLWHTIVDQGAEITKNGSLITCHVCNKLSKLDGVDVNPRTALGWLLIPLF